MYVTWDELMDAVVVMAKLLKEKQIYGLPRGGAIIARLLEQRGCVLASMGDCGTLYKETIIVDDIADSGETLAKWREAGYITAALFVRTGRCAPLPHVHINEVEGKDYVAFPYEDPREVERMKQVFQRALS